MCCTDDWRVILEAIDEPWLLVSADARITYSNRRAREIAALAECEVLAEPGERPSAELLSFLAKCAKTTRPLHGLLVLAAPGACGTVQMKCIGRRVQFASGAAYILLRLRPGPAQLAVADDANVRAVIRRAERIERARIARDLHDQAGQHALCLKLGLAQLRNRCTDGNALAAIDELMVQVDAVVSDLHRTIADLRPPLLDELGFEQALQVLAERWSRASGVPVNFEIVGEPADLNKHIEAALFRVLQEALTNIAKHATGVRAVTVMFRHAQGCATLTIRDDGRGLRMVDRRAAAMIRNGKLGLAGMHERMARLGGELELRSTDSRGRGTMVVARVHSAACHSMRLGHAV